MVNLIKKYSVEVVYIIRPVNKEEVYRYINENCFDKCLGILKSYGYKFYFVDEINEKLTIINKFSSDLKKTKGPHCYATIKQV